MLYYRCNTNLNTVEFIGGFATTASSASISENDLEKIGNILNMFANYPVAGSGREEAASTPSNLAVWSSEGNDWINDDFTGSGSENTVNSGWTAVTSGSGTGGSNTTLNGTNDTTNNTYSYTKTHNGVTWKYTKTKNSTSSDEEAASQQDDASSDSWSQVASIMNMFSKYAASTSETTKPSNLAVWTDSGNNWIQADLTGDSVKSSWTTNGSTSQAVVTQEDNQQLQSSTKEATKTHNNITWTL